MGVYANGTLLYGYVRDDATEELFAHIETLDETIEKDDDEDEYDGEEDESFEGRFSEAQTKHSVSLYTISYEGIDVIEAFSVHASGKRFDYKNVPNSDLAKEQEYDAHLRAFFAEIGAVQSYPAGWYILGYMD